MVPVMCRKLQMQARSHYPWCSCNFNKSKLSILAGTLTALKVLMWPATQWIRTAWSKTSATVLNLKSRLAFLMGNDDDNVMMRSMWWWWRCDDDNDLTFMTTMWWCWQCDDDDNMIIWWIWVWQSISNQMTLIAILKNQYTSQLFHPHGQVSAPRALLSRHISAHGCFFSPRSLFSSSQVNYACPSS